MNDEIELGRASGAYGFRGWVRIQPLASGEVLRKVKQWILVSPTGERQTLAIEAVREHGQGLIAKWHGCDTKEAADLARGLIYVSRADFPSAGDDTVWAVDLIGCQVKNESGVLLGEVSRIGSNGVQDLLEVKWHDEKGKDASFMIPLVKDVYLKAIDLDARTIVVDWDPDWR